MTAMPPTPPVELEAERALLGAFLLEPNLLGPYVETLPSELFFKEACRYVWEAIRTLYGADQGIDAITVAAELRRVGRFEDAGGHSFLAVLQEEATVATQVESYVRLVQAAATKRELLALGGRLVHGTENGDAVETLCADIRTTLDWVAADRSGHTPAEPLGIGLGEFLGRDFPPLEPIVEGLLYTDGGGWIGGEEKLGKSYYAVEEALCIALGRPVCGRYRVPVRRRVFFIEEEDPPATLDRLRRDHGVIFRILHLGTRPSRGPSRGAPPPHPSAPPLTASPRRRRMARGQRAIARPTPPGLPARVPGQASRGG